MDVLATREGDVAILRLNRPEKLNAVTPELLDLLGDTLTAAAADGARAVLITGEGRAFSSGADLSAAGDTRDPGATLRRHYNPLATIMAELPIPIVSAVNGPAVGAGLSIALAGDIVVAARSAVFQLAFANIGLVPDAGATWLVGKAVGRAKLLEMALLAEPLAAADALAAGLITRVAEDAELMPVALGLAHRLAAMPTVALGLIRAQAATALGGTLAETMEAEATHQSQAAATSDFREGIAAFREKRVPRFSGL